MSTGAVERLKVKQPWRDIAFWAALTPILIAFAPGEVKAWISENEQALYPLIAWLVANGWIRKSSVRAAGEVLSMREVNRG